MDAPPTWQHRRSAALDHQLTKKGRQGLRVERAADGYLYRPGQLLLGRGAVDVLRSEVGRDAVTEDEATNARFSRRGVDVQRWMVDASVGLPELHRAIDGRVRARGSHVELNHVFTGEWYYEGGPATEPQLAATLPLPQGALPAGSTAHLAVLDTGVAAPTHPFFSAMLLGQDGTDVDMLDEDSNSYLDTEAGHGTFICGVVQRVAPGLGMEQRKVLNSSGFGDDLTVALGVAETTAPVLNLSLGGYTRHDRRPRALEAALDALDPSRVVVAAAGNNGRRRQFWPAAFPRVVAVAAYDSRTGEPAAFSNYGPWVDVCAPGVDLHSSYVDGRRGPDPDDGQFTGWATWSGTSFAAPVVAAEIAHRASLSPGRTAAQVAADLLAELGALPRDGYGRRFVPRTELHLPTPGSGAVPAQAAAPAEQTAVQQP
ncbi:hypothetical protein GCM10027446_17930 [Angustibacter peucedani]